MRSALPATRQAAGVPSAWSQPSQSTHERPRRWCDAGSLGRQSVTAAQKAGDVSTGVHDGSANLKIVITLTAMIHRAATPTRDGWVAGAQAPAYNSGSTIAPLGRDRHPTRTRGKPRHIGVPGTTLCRNDHPATRHAPHNVIPGSLGKRVSPWFSRLTRQAAGVPSAWSQPSQSTHERPRRWCDAGPLGRQNQLKRPNTDSCAKSPTCALGDQVEQRRRNRDSDRDRGSGSSRDSVPASPSTARMAVATPPRTEAV